MLDEEKATQLGIALYEKLGSNLYSVQFALHSLTGCDITSREGTKKEAFWGSFKIQPLLSENYTKLTEHLLVKIL